MATFKALTPVRADGKRFAPGELLELTEKDGRALVKAGAVEPAKGKPAVLAPNGGGSSFPEDFPGKEALEAAGFTEPSQLIGKSVDELGAIKGIGPKTVEKLLALFKEA